MNLDLLLPLLVTTGVVMIGWFVLHRLAEARDRANKSRELRVSFLIEAYRRLEFASRREHDSKTVKALESALADIQLMGSPEQVALIPQYLKALTVDPTTDAGPLLELLRKELRQELRLPAITGGGLVVRVGPSVFKRTP